jgi:hypothetical protein
MSDIEIIGKRMFTFYSEDAGLWIQITQVRFDGHIGYVREKRRGRPGESFVMSSNTRLGHKADGNRIGREVLELAIDKRLFKQCAKAVRAMDTMDREVLKSNRWAFEYAANAWEQAGAER